MSAKIERKTYTLTVDSCPNSGRVLTEAWSDQQGRLNSVGENPAYTKYDEFGDVVILVFAKEGVSHRSHNLPSSYTLDKSQNKEIYHYEVQGRLHRTNGPAIEHFDLTTGDCIYREYWLNGREMPAPSDAPQPVLD